MTAQEFVKNYFQFHTVVALTPAQLHTAAAVMLRVHNRFYGAPEREARFLFELQKEIEVKLCEEIQKFD